MKIKTLSNIQRLNLVNSKQLYEQWISAYESAQSYRYGMRWIERSGKNYLMRLIDARGNMRSLGPRSETTEHIYNAFIQGKGQAKARYASLSQEMEQQRKLNRAVAIDRLPTDAAKVLQALNLHGLTRDLVVIGTHAIFAYESLAGVQYAPDVLATKDIDLLHDRRRPLKILSKKMPETGLIGLLKSVDKSFEPVGNKRYFRAANKKGFLVDFVTATADMRTRSDIQFAADDFIAAEVPNIEWLNNAQKIKEIVIAENGLPVAMTVPDPRAFALHKAWLSTRVDRDPVKKARDREQANVVVKTVLDYLPHLEFDARQLKYLTQAMIAMALDVIESDENESLMLPKMKF